MGKISYTIVPPGGHDQMTPEERILARALRRGTTLVAAQREDGTEVEITRVGESLVIRTQQK